jgi:bifunctional DNase/RNase
MKMEMKIHGLIVDPVTNMPIVILKAVDREQMLPIWVGVYEANAIALQMESVEPPRPMTHDLLRSIIQRLDATVNEITVCDLKDNTFYARVSLQRGADELVIDSRPSDAIALALRADCPIFVEDSVMSQARSNEPESLDSDDLRAWLESLRPEDLGEYEM